MLMRYSQLPWKPNFHLSHLSYFALIKFQIGHLRSDDKTISSPKFVTPLSDKKIRDVSTSDGSVVVMTESGDVIALHDFSTRRILSAKTFDVVKMVATGGHLDPKIVPNSDLVIQRRRFKFL
jgi:hypothetical protein